MIAIGGSAPIKMPAPAPASQRRVLEPFDRVSEVLFGLIMVLTFTGSLSIAEAGRDDIRTMLVGALGCNLAWGIIDGVFFVMGNLADRNRELHFMRSLRVAPDQAAAAKIVAEVLPPLVAANLQPAELEAVGDRLRHLPAPPARTGFKAEDWHGALGVFFLVFFTTFPVVLPFIFMSNSREALRISNLIAVVMLFGAGFAFGRIIGRSPWLAGIGFVFLGSTLVGLTIALGG